MNVRNHPLITLINYLQNKQNIRAECKKLSTDYTDLH